MAPEASAPTPRAPLPRPDDATAPYWQACSRGELHMQRCADCGRWRFPPRPMCPGCRSLADEWVRVSGRGHVFSFVVCHPPVLPAFRERTPYAVVLVELAEDPGLRVLGNLQGLSPEAIRIGLPVEVVFEDAGEGIALPQWRATD
ncbi:MAG: Zn-ribbon domain-containing OB-fold protein [Myxococcota bacterium]